MYLYRRAVRALEDDTFFPISTACLDCGTTPIKVQLSDPLSIWMRKTHMDTLEQNHDRYSAEIRLWMSCEHGKFALAQVGDSFVLSDQPLHIPSCDAWVHVKIDGKEFKRHVAFYGMMGDCCEASISPKDGIPI